MCSYKAGGKQVVIRRCLVPAESSIRATFLTGGGGDVRVRQQTQNGSNIVITHTFIPQIPSRGHIVLLRNPFTTAHDNILQWFFYSSANTWETSQGIPIQVFFFFFVFRPYSLFWKVAILSLLFSFLSLFFCKLLLALMFAKITAQVTLPFFFQGGPFVVRPRCPLKRTLTNVRHCYKNPPIRPFSVQCFVVSNMADVLSELDQFIPRPPSVRSYNACSALPPSTFSALESVGKLIFHR